MSSTVTASARQYTRANSEYHSIADNASFTLGSGNFAFAYWFKLSATGIIQNISGQVNSTYTLSTAAHGNLVLDTNKLVGRIGVGGALYDITGGTTLSSGVWYHAVFMRNGNNLELYLNGASDATPVAVTGLTANDSANNFSIGRAGEFASNTFGGALQSFGYWNRVLTSGEIASIYNSGSGKLYKDLSTAEKVALTSWWDGAETSGVLIDAHGSNTLTDNNTVSSAAGKVTYTAEDASQFTAANSEYLSISNASQVGLNFGDADFYIASWVRGDTILAQSDIVAKWNATGNQKSYLMLYYAAGGGFAFGVSGNGSASTFAYDTTFGATAVANNWYLIEGAHDSVNNLVKVSVNGRAWTTAAHSTGVYSSSTAGFNIGSRDGTTLFVTNGREANTIVTSGIPTDAERALIFARGFGCDVSDKPTLSSATYVSWWKLDEASGTRYDSIGSNDLTDNNTVTGAAGVVYDVPAVVSSSTKSLALLGVG